MKHGMMMALVVAGFLTTPALAKGPHGHGHGGKHEDRGRPDHHDHDRDDRRGGDRVVIVPQDRLVINRYIERRYADFCPPGQAKKGRCGYHAPRYHVGEPLPSYVVYQPVPRDLLVELQPVPVGYQYVMVDRDVLLISEAGHHVIDAITLLSAVR